jgi:glycolate oxidase iron-sulfur subunit
LEAHLAEFIRDTADGREAEAILRACVHCGFCTATCPTYQLLGDELDGPRGRIYLIKQLLESGEASASTQLHLDRCLTCRSCETTCPSGVRYGRLADIGRQVLEERVPRARGAAAWRWLLRRTLLTRGLFASAVAIGRVLRPLLPEALKGRVPSPRPVGRWPRARHERRMLALVGCVQPALAPSIDAAMARVLDRLEISLIRVRGSGCCGAMSYHLAAQEDALARMRANIDAWWPEIERGAEAIVVTASGCGVMVKDYGEALKHDPAYASKARRIAELARDPVEIVATQWKRLAPRVAMDHGPDRVALHTPCSLQHAQKLNGRIDEIIEALGFELTPVADAHLCCGSAGTYSILQSELANELRANKLAALEAGKPNVIATANIGCQMHLAAATHRPVLHWIELLDARLRS